MIGAVASLAMLSLAFAACGGNESSSSVEACTEGDSGFDLGFVTLGDGDQLLDVGFYAFFEPVSYSQIADQSLPEFNIHRGFEADLLTALEAIESAGLSFYRHAIPEWEDIWLQPTADAGLDMVGGGITILDSRTRDAQGREAVRFTSGHIAFRQSLLVKTEDAERLSSYEALTSDVRVGVLAGTTGEARLLQLVGISDAYGVLTAGTRIETADGEVVADGSSDYFITAAAETPAFDVRKRLYPASESMPQLVYLGDRGGEAEFLAALHDGEIDGLARGEIENRDASHASDDTLAVSILDDAVEWGGFTLSVENAELTSCIDSHINYLTDDRRIGFAEWQADPDVFLKRAEQR